MRAALKIKKRKKMYNAVQYQYNSTVLLMRNLFATEDQDMKLGISLSVVSGAKRYALRLKHNKGLPRTRVGHSLEREERLRSLSGAKLYAGATDNGGVVNVSVAPRPELTGGRAVLLDPIPIAAQGPSLANPLYHDRFRMGYHTPAGSPLHSNPNSVKYKRKVNGCVLQKDTKSPHFGLPSTSNPDPNFNPDYPHAAVCKPPIPIPSYKKHFATRIGTKELVETGGGWSS